MAAGLQAWDANGNMLVDITSRLGRFIGMKRVAGNADSVTDMTLTQGEAFFSFQPDLIWGYINNDISRPIFNYSNGVISWSYSSPSSVYNYKIPGWLFYGVR